MQVRLLPLPPAAATAAATGGLFLFGFDMFTKMKGIRKLKAETYLYYIFRNFLSKPESLLSEKALNILFLYKLKYLQPYQSNMIKLVNDVAFREELLKFNINTLNELTLIIISR